VATHKTQEWLSNRREAIQSADYDKEVQQAIIDFLDAYNPNKLRIDPPMRKRGNEREDTQTTPTKSTSVSK